MSKFNFFRKKEPTFTDKVKKSDNIHPEIKELFIGRRTIFSLMGFIVGGILFGSSLWEYSKEEVGLPLTMLAGIAIFTISGIVGKEFRK